METRISNLLSSWVQSFAKRLPLELIELLYINLSLVALSPILKSPKKPLYGAKIMWFGKPYQSPKKIHQNSLLYKIFTTQYLAWVESTFRFSPQAKKKNYEKFRILRTMKVKIDAPIPLSISSMGKIATHLRISKKISPILNFSDWRVYSLSDECG